MRYIHPTKYKGLRLDTPNNQLIMKAFVETNCLKCDLFCGKEHDFAECKVQFNPRSNDTTCPPECRRGVSHIDPESEIKCESENTVNYNRKIKEVKTYKT